MTTEIIYRYKALGDLIVKYRKEAGLTQAEFARLTKCAQQTASRWEQGASRPREKQITLIASILKLVKSGEIDSEELLIAAGYLNKRIVTTSFDQPFPLDSLSWEGFQQFCMTVLKSIYSKYDCIVHHNGGRGHSQNGFDIEVVFPDKTVYQFDCKREKKFTRTDVLDAVKKNATNANKKFLLLAYEASSAARDEIKNHAPIWDIWDVKDISEEVRQKLSTDEKIKLIDRYFPRQRFALLGEVEAGPWQTVDEFFKPFKEKLHLFNHKWNLVGREKQVQEILEALTNPDKKLIFVTGAGGIGKSRFLMEIIEKHQSIFANEKILFLNPTESISTKNFEDIGKDKKLLVIDDAHDVTLENIERLLKYAADISNNTTLVFALRKYGIDLIKHQASLSFPWEEKYIFELSLEVLNLKQATELATQVLTEFNGPIELAEHIARFTKDCPLATVVGARIVAQEKSHFEFAKNKDAFCSVFKGKFRKVLAGEIGKKGDEEKIRKILSFIALIQPFNEYDKSIAENIERLEGIPSHEVNSLISLLEEGGILLKRGEIYRIMPDMLADFIIEEACIGYNGSSNGYAEKILDISSDAYLKHILVNLAKLDWRLSEGEPDKSNLLNAIWNKLNSANYIDVITEIAYYQPERALSFAEFIMRDGNYHRNLPELIKYAAYNLNQLERACGLLWELSNRENKISNYRPGHAIQILCELCEVKPNKIRQYSEIVINFCLDLLKLEDSWKYTFTPFDILKSILPMAGRTFENDGLNFIISSFEINYDFVVELRSRVIIVAIELLSHKNIKMALSAARFLEDAVRYQYPVKITTDEWKEDVVKTLQKIDEAIKANELNKLILIQLGNSISWHARHASGEIQKIARQLINSLPSSLDFRATVELINGHAYRQDVRNELTDHESLDNESREKIAAELISTYPNGQLLCEYIESIILDINENFSGRGFSSFSLYESLIKLDLSFAKAILESALKNPNPKTAWFARMAMSEILRKEYQYGIKVASQFFDTDIEILQVAVAYGYAGYYSVEDRNYTQDDIELLKKLLRSDKEQVVLGVLCAMRNIAKNSPKLVINFLKYCNFASSKEIANHALLIFQDTDIPFDLLNHEDIVYFLEQLEKVPELDGHWTESFLAKASKFYARITAKFFMNRVEYAVSNQDWGYRPCNYGPYGHVPLCFRESVEFTSLLKEVSEWWMNSNRKNDPIFYKNAGHVFNMMFSPFNDEVVGYLWEWAKAGTANDFSVISKILGEAQKDFVFKYRLFVIRYLEKAKYFNDRECYDSAIFELCRSAIHGAKAGRPGYPFAEDLELEDLSKMALNEIPKYSPAYLLYEQLKKCAENNIQRSNKDREYLFSD